MTIDLTNIVLKQGSHAYRGQGMCAMEAAAYVAGEKHSDHPACVSPVIGAFMRSWNDSLPDDESRTRLLLPLIPKILNTAGSSDVEERRSWMAVDWMARTYAPAWLGLAGLTEHASALRALAPIVDAASAEASNDALKAARAAAGDAARAAAWDAASDAAWDAAWAATRAAAWNAVWDAAGAAAGAAAWTAARAAAWNAAGAAAYTSRKLAPTVELLQASAVYLVERMVTL